MADERWETLGAQQHFSGDLLVPLGSAPDPQKRELIHGSGFSKADTPVGWRTGNDGGGEL